MTEQQIPKLMAKLVEHQKQFGSLSKKDAQHVIQHPDWIIPFIVNSIKECPKSLKFAGTIKIPATTKEFIVKDKFTDNADLKIFYMTNSAFAKTWFSDKVEKHFAGSTLYYMDLMKHSLDKSIIADIDRDKIETSLFEVNHLMKKQPNGEEGVLLTNGKDNTFYCRDSKDDLRVVYVNYLEERPSPNEELRKGWHLYACPIDWQIIRNIGTRIFFRS